MAYLTTHNAYNSAADNFLFPNQNGDILTQLQDGVRGLMLDIYIQNGTPVVYHGSALLGSMPLADVLSDIRNFMAANPNEIVTLILECYVDANTIETSLSSAGLDSLLYAHIPGFAWPTLQDMISANTRLVVFSDVNDAGPGQGWYHYVWDYAVETDFSVHDRNDFTCDFNRGDSLNDLFILNHFVTDANVGIGLENEAVLANAYNFFFNRALQCQTSKGLFPNFPTIDFHDRGDGLAVVNALNGISVSKQDGFSEGSVTVYPQPATNDLWIELQEIVTGPTEWELYSLSGVVLARTEVEPLVGTTKIHLDVSAVPQGIYMLVGRAENRILHRPVSIVD